MACGHLRPTTLATAQQHATTQQRVHMLPWVPVIEEALDEFRESNLGVYLGLGAFRDVANSRRALPEEKPASV